MVPNVAASLAVAVAVAAAVTPGVNGQNLTNGTDGSAPVYKDPSASVDDRVQDLLSRMTLQEKVAQLIQGDITNFINETTGDFNASGLVWNMEWRAGQIWTGYPIPQVGSMYDPSTRLVRLTFVQQTIAEAGRIAQDYLLHNTTLGIPALVRASKDFQC